MARLSVPGGVAELGDAARRRARRPPPRRGCRAADWPLGLPRPSGPAGRARPGVPPGCPPPRPDAPALRSGGDRLLDLAGGPRGAADADTRDADAAVGRLLLGPDPARRSPPRDERVPHVRRAPRRGGGRRDRRRRLRVAGSAAPTGRPLPGLGRRRGRGRRVLRSADGGRRLHPGFRGRCWRRHRRSRATRRSSATRPDASRHRPKSGPATTSCGCSTPSRPGCDGPRQPTGRPRAPCWSRPASA